MRALLAVGGPAAGDELRRDARRGARRRGDGRPRGAAESTWASTGMSRLLGHPRADRLLRRLPGAVRRSTSRSGRARWWRSSAPTAPASRRFCGPSAGSCRSPRAQCGCDGRPSAALPRASRSRRGAWPWCPRAGASSRSLSVEENLLAGAYLRRAGPWSLARVYELFPSCSEKRRAYPRTLSGGEQQMAAIGRGADGQSASPHLRRASLGLAPVVVKSLYEALGAGGAGGTRPPSSWSRTWRWPRACRSSLYCFQEGRVSLRGAPPGSRAPRSPRAYFGV